MTYAKSRKWWVYHAGERFKNRVTLREQRVGSIAMTWCEGGRDRRKHTGTHDRFRAIIIAEEKAAELLGKRPKRPTYRPEVEIIRIRQDLQRVAQEYGAPPGVAPWARIYAKLGAFSVSRAQSAFSGYRQVGRYYQCVDSWTAAMRRFGLKPAGHGKYPTERDLLIDLRRVALALGAPLEMPPSEKYDRMGKYRHTTVRTHFPGLGWPEIGDRAGLTTPEQRRTMSARNRATSHEQRTEQAA